MAEKLSVYILAFNEEAKIADTIKSVLWADEVVVIDSFSTDQTVEISEKLGARVVQIKFEVQLSYVGFPTVAFKVQIEAEEIVRVDE